MLWLVGGCLYISDAEHTERLASLGGDTETGEVEQGSIPVDSVDPSYGTTAGQTRVEVHGGPFTQDARVLFDGTAGQVESVTDDTIVVYTPAGTEGKADVRVETTSAWGGLTDGFQYWEDGEGMVGAFGEFALFRLTGGYWSPKQEDYRRVSMGFVRPIESWEFWRYWGPELDQCLHIDQSGAQSYTYDPDFEKYDARGGTVTVAELSGTNVVLDWNNNDLLYEKQDLAAAQYIPGGVYTARLEDSPVLPELDISGAFYLPEEFQVTSPDIDALELPTIQRATSVRWTGGTRGEAVLIQIGVLNSSETTFQEQVYCAAEDDGSFDIPSSLWTNWQSGHVVNVLIGRYHVGDGLLAFNDAQVATVGQYFFYGAGESE